MTKLKQYCLKNEPSAKKSVKELLAERGLKISRQTVYLRMAKGLTFEEAVSFRKYYSLRPPRFRGQVYGANLYVRGRYVEGVIDDFCAGVALGLSRFMATRKLAARAVEASYRKPDGLSVPDGRLAHAMGLSAEDFIALKRGAKNARANAARLSAFMASLGGKSLNAFAGELGLNRHFVKKMVYMGFTKPQIEAIPPARKAVLFGVAHGE